MNILISQVYYSINKHNLLLNNIDKIKELFIDSGGFSWQQKGFIETEEKYFNKYLKKIKLIQELINKGVKVKFIQLDKPLHNLQTRLLWEKQKHLPNFYPVFTISDDLEYLEYLCKNNNFIFIGGINNMTAYRVDNFLKAKVYNNQSILDIIYKYNVKYYILGKGQVITNDNNLYSYDMCITNALGQVGIVHSKLSYLNNIYNVVNKSSIQKIRDYIFINKFNKYYTNKFFYAMVSISTLYALFNGLTQAEEKLYEIYVNTDWSKTNFKTKREQKEIDIKEKYYLDLFN